MYSKWNNNPLFLYNYGAQLNYVEKYEESNHLLIECKNYFNNQNLQLVVADNYQNLKNTPQAIYHYKLALAMCPNRFIPLYQLMKIYEEEEETEKVKKVAHQILDKPVKIQSAQVNHIKREAKKRLENKK